MFNSNSTPFTMPVTPTSANNGVFGGDGWWVIIIFALIFGWGGNGNGLFGGRNGGVNDGYILTSDFSQLSQQLSDSTAMTERKLDSITNGICSLGYDQLNQMNGINTNILQSSNAIASQLAECCCNTREAISGVNYNLATQANGITNAINNGFCQTNFNAQTNTRDIVDAQNCGTQAILAKLSQMESNAKDERIAELQTINSDLRFQASQVAQNAFIQNLVKPPINPCYVTQNPYCSCGNAYYGYGTTIA